MRCVAYQIPVAFFLFANISSSLRRWCPYCIIFCLALLAKNLQSLSPSSAHGLVKTLRLQKLRNSSCILPSYFTTLFRPQLGSCAETEVPGGLPYTLLAPPPDAFFPNVCIVCMGLFVLCPTIFFVEKLISPRSLFFLFISRKSNSIVISNTRPSLA